MIDESNLRKIIREALISEIRFASNDLGILREARVKTFKKVMRQVYDNLPDHVFNDMYSQEKQWSNIFDDDIGSEIQKLTGAVLRNQPKALENFREFERKRGSVWIDTVWNKRSKSLNLEWNDLSASKRNFFKNKYTGKLSYFLATDGGHGYLDKLKRLLPIAEQSSEPVVLLQSHSEPGLDIIGGNNRTFAAFFSIAMKGLENTDVQSLTPDAFNAIFDYLDRENPAIQISAFVGKRV